MIDVISLLFRWAHLFFAIAWIGASMFFVWLDFSLRKRSESAEAILGETWMVHGGGFYLAEKYSNAPDRMPKKLHWFIMDAYMTWVTGFLLMFIQYYLNAPAFLIDTDKFTMTSEMAVVISMLSLGFGWLVYNSLCLSFLKNHTALLAVAVVMLILVMADFYLKVFTDRAAFLHTGALIATFMSGNVFFNIIPNQRKAVASLLKGEKPDPRYGLEAKQRSLHNNYLTMTVVLMMISNHYPQLYSHEYNWWLLVLIMLLGAFIRHSINLHDKGTDIAIVRRTLGLAAITLITFVALMVYQPSQDFGSAHQISDQQGLALIQTHCSSCHAEAPRHLDHDVAPAGVILESLSDVKINQVRIIAQTVKSKIMPLGNETDMTPEDRVNLGIWLNKLTQ